MLELSYSKIRTYLNCPWLYKLKYIDDKKAPPSPEASLGISLHKALEKFHREKGTSKEGLIAALDDVWERPGYQDSTQELEFYDKAGTILSTYWGKIASKWRGEVLEVEKMFSLEFPEMGVRLMGTVDRLDRLSDGSMALIEYKTHAAMWEAKRIEEDLQITLYHHALGKEGPLKVLFFFVTQGEMVEVKRTESHWKEAAKIISETASAIEGKKFEPKTSYCSYCEMNRFCQYSAVSPHA